MGVRVDLHIWSLTETADAAILSADETARMDRFVYPKHRQAFLAARAGLRRVLGASCGIDPADLQFSYGPQGKPAMSDGPRFNLSHTGDLACLALHTDIALGVDIEAFRTVEDGIAERFFSPVEHATLTALPPSAQQAGFFRCWTRKESVIKALGGGLSIPLDAFDVTLDPCSAALTRLEPDYGRADDWALAPFQIGPKMMGCVAAQTGGASITLEVKSAPPGVNLNA
ncbi:MAG: 4'-phosphopantetheinyl transferase superfamily protein [Pseudomonadota bacterium]